MARSTQTTPTLFVIGGAEDRAGNARVLRRFIRLAGGRRSRIVVVPTASSFQVEASAAYETVFARLGCPEVTVVNPVSRQDAADPSLVARLDEATGIFLTGGSQLRLSQFFPGTPAGQAIHRAYARGAVVGGTSAGASIMSEFMIALGEEGSTPRQGASQLTAGLGLIKGVVIDQHFGQRSRYGRLMAMVAGSPALIGIGIDENTAIEITDGREFTVHGNGVVFVLDCRFARTDAADARDGAPLMVSGAVVHSLPAGATFNLESVQLVDFVEQHPYVEAASSTTTS